MRKDFYDLYEDKYITVSEYYNDFRDAVEIVDIRDLDSELFEKI